MAEAVSTGRAGGRNDRRDPAAEFDSRRALSRLLPAGVLLVLATAAVAAFVVVRQTVDDQHHRILRERTNEAALVLQGLLGDVTASMRSLGVAARLDGSHRAFVDEARAVTARSPGEAAALVGVHDGTPTVLQATGPRVARGAVLGGRRAVAVRRAVRQQTTVTTPVFSAGPQRVLGFAIGPPVAPPGRAIYLEAVIKPAAGAAAAASSTSPFHELNVVVYASPRPRAGQAVLRTAAEPPTGDVATGSFLVGRQRWSVAATARSSLVGSFADAVPWVILGVGLLSAAGTALTVFVLVRRRNYALGLVDERTAELAASLEELELAQARLVRQERLATIGQVAAAVGHELRNPLGVLTNALYLVRTAVSPGDQERVARHLDIAEREIAASVVIVESLLDFARDRAPATGPVAVADLVEESLEVAAPPDGVTAVRRGLDNVPPALADRQQLRQVLLNLLTNAYQAIDGEGQVTIEATTDAQRIELRVSDTGVGMEAETLEQVFDPFFTRRVKGIGLGLAVTKRIVEAHGGAIHAASTPGRGTTFTVELPLATTREPALP